MNRKSRWVAVGLVAATAMVGATAQAGKEIIHDAEYYVLKAQHGEKWAEQDKAIDANWFLHGKLISNV